MALRLLVALACLSFATAVQAQQPTPPDAIEKLVARLEQALANADRPALLALAVKDADATSLDDFAAATSAKPTRVVIKERDRMPLDGKRQQILIEVFVERGIEAQLSTWRVELRPPSSKADGADWHIERMEPISTVAGLYRLGLNTAKQYDVRNLVVEGTDVSIDMSAGTAFVAEIADGPTAVILLGRGRIRFAPPDTAERTQIRIFTGADDLQSEFDAAFIRLRPSEFQERFRAESLVPRGVVAADLRRASEIFDEYISKTLQIDLTDLSRDRWSLIPSAGDLIAEVRTRRFGSLTYARSGNEAEDVTVFDRKRRRNISIYASGTKLDTRGRFYSEDDLVDYDIMSYDMDATFAPERYWINGTVHMRVRVRAGAMTTMTLKLAEALTVRGVYAPGFGRLLHLRVVNQNSLIVNLPAPVFKDNEFALTIIYSGRLEPSELDREAIAVQQTAQQEREPLVIPLEPRYIYSNNSYWYPQSTVSDYALGTVRITVPNEFDVVATGTSTGPAKPVAETPAGGRPQKTFVFQNDRPVRYLSCVISRMTSVTSTRLPIRPSSGDFGDVRVDIPDPGAPAPQPSARPASTSPAAAPAPADETSLALTVRANARQVGRARNIAEQTSAILQYHASIIGEAPYPSFTLAVTENELPGGHSPGLLRGAESGAADDAKRLAERSRQLRKLSPVLSRARTGASVVGPGGRLEELSRAVAERGVRAVLRGALRREGARPERVSVSARGRCAIRDRHVGARPDLPGLSAWPHPRRTSSSSARSFTTSRRSSCTCCGASSATTRSFSGCGGSTPNGDSRKPAPTISVSRWKRRPAVTWDRSSKRGFSESRSRALRFPTAHPTRALSSSSSSTAAMSCRCRSR